jgi:hypothetical protein
MRERGTKRRERIVTFSTCRILLVHTLCDFLFDCSSVSASHCSSEPDVRIGPSRPFPSVSTVCLRPASTMRAIIVRACIVALAILACTTPLQASGTVYSAIPTAVSALATSVLPAAVSGPQFLAVDATTGITYFT